MRIRYMMSLLITFFCISCDIPFPLIIDGQKDIVLSDECGTIAISGASFSTSVWFTCTFKGKYHINADSLKIKALFSGDTITDCLLKLNKEKLREKKFYINGNDTLDFSCDLLPKKPDHVTTKKILILPSRFITCEGKPVITDTIVIQLKH